MPRHLLTIVLTVSVLATSSPPSLPAQAAVANTADGPLTSAQALADFDLLRKGIEEAHGAPYRYSTKAALDRRFDGYRQRLGASVSRRGFIGLISEMVAELRDGHARLEYDAATNATLSSARLMPLRVQVEGERLIIMSNDSPSDSTMRPGMEVTSINGQGVPDILAAIGPKVPVDGFVETGRRVRVSRMFAPFYWLFVDSSDVFVIAARRASGASVTTTLRGVLGADRETSMNPVNAAMRAASARLDGLRDNVSLSFPAAGVARLRIRGFDGRQFTSELDSVFRTVRERQIEALILDLRGNGGGVDEYGASLVSHFVGTPFRYFDRIHLASIHPSFATWRPGTFDEVKAGTVADPAGGFLATTALHSGVGLQQPASAPFTGDLYVLIDGGTFSTSADVTATLHNMKRAAFIGEETAGGYEGNTSGLNALIVLPNSGLGLKIMMFGYYNAVTPPANGRGTVPDHVVARRAADVLNGVDAALDRAVALAREKLGTKKSPSIDANEPFSRPCGARRTLGHCAHQPARRLHLRTARHGRSVRVGSVVAAAVLCGTGGVYHCALLRRVCVARTPTNHQPPAGDGRCARQAGFLPARGGVLARGRPQRRHPARGDTRSRARVDLPLVGTGCSEGVSIVVSSLVMTTQFRSLIVAAAVLVAAPPVSHAQTATAQRVQRQDVVADDGHHLALWSTRPTGQPKGEIVLLHGRTWSALPNFDLHAPGQKVSVMEALADLGYAVYALDQRGYGQTARDKTGWLTPLRAAADAEAVTDWVASRAPNKRRPALLGYSRGSGTAMLAAQRHPEKVSSLILYAPYYNIAQRPDVPAEAAKPPRAATTREAAGEDFLTPDSTPAGVKAAYVRSAVQSDPVRVDWRHEEQFNVLDPAKVRTPTLILHGELDPVAKDAGLADFFTRLATVDRSWMVLAHSDHVAHLERTAAWVHAVTSFLERPGVRQVR
ncbi:MAG: alpha/beta fold hydrolase [bacterium]